MNYGQLKANVQALLNRNDVTPSLIDNFTQAAIQRAQRIFDVPAMQQVGQITAIIDDVEAGRVGVPGDYIKMVSLKVNNRELKAYPLNVVLNTIASGNAGAPSIYAIDGYYIKIAPMFQVDDFIEITYNADFSWLAADTDENWITKVAPDIIMYGALVEGCNFFSDPRGIIFDKQFVDRLASANTQAHDDVLVNAAMAPSYDMDFTEDY